MQNTLRAVLIASLLLTACDDSSNTKNPGDTSVAGDSSADSRSDLGADVTIPDAQIDTPSDGTTTPDTQPADVPADTTQATGGEAWRGDVLFFEGFEDTDFAARDWYDDSANTVLSSSDPVTGSSAYECRFAQGATGCTGGTMGRHQFAEQGAVYLSYWVKYSDNYVGSQRAYHPHEFHFITNKDDRWVGPSYTFLTTYIEQVGGEARIALQDSKNSQPGMAESRVNPKGCAQEARNNVDSRCILTNNDSFVGCNGDFASYAFTESRSVCACNGIQGDLDMRDCYDSGGGVWNSSRTWGAESQTFVDAQGPNYKGDWHFIEVVFVLNSIAGGVGVADGSIRYWFDGNLLISSDQILMRTAQNADMAFNQFLVAPYIGDGSPVEQVMWIDDLTVAEAHRP